MAEIIHVHKKPQGGLMRVTELHIGVGHRETPTLLGEVVRYEHRETEQVDHYGSHFTGNFAACLIGGAIMTTLLLSMVFA